MKVICHLRVALEQEQFNDQLQQQTTAMGVRGGEIWTMAALPPEQILSLWRYVLPVLIGMYRRCRSHLPVLIWSHFILSWARMEVTVTLWDLVIDSGLTRSSSIEVVSDIFTHSFVMPDLKSRCLACSHCASSISSFVAAPRISIVGHVPVGYKGYIWLQHQ